MRLKFSVFLICLLSLSGFSQTDFPLETVLQKGHTDYIRAYDFSKDSKFVASGGFDNLVILWEVESGKQIRTYAGHTERIRSIYFSPDQTQILTLGADNKIIIFEVITGKIVATFEIPDQELYRVFYSKNGQYIYATDDRHGVFLWKIAGDYIGKFQKDYSAFVEPDLMNLAGDRILSEDDGKGSVVIDVASKDTVFSIPFDKVHSQSYSPNGMYIGISSRKLFSSVYNAQTGALIHEFRYDENECDGGNTKHVFSPDSKYLITMSSKTPATIWEIETGKKIRSYLTLDDTPSQLVFSELGTYVLISFDDEVYVYDTRTGRERIHVSSEKIDYYDFKFSQNEEYIVLPNDNGGLDLWSLKKGKILKTIQGYLNQPNATGMNLSYSNWIQQSILKYIQHKRKVLLSPDNENIVVGGIDTCAMLINLKTGRIVQTFQGHSKSVIAFDFTPDGKYLATGGGDRNIQIWEVKTGKLEKTLDYHQETIFDLKFSKDGETLLSGSWDGSARIWAWRKGTSKYMDFGNISPYCIGFTPDELYIVSADVNKNVQFWERDALAPFRTLVGHTDIPSGFDFNPDGKTMVTSSWDGKVRVWDLISGMLIAKMTHHQGQVYGVKYDPKGRFIASCGADNKIILWDPISNKIIATLVGHSSAITSLDLTSDGKQLVSISVDGVIKLWNLDTFTEVYSRIQLSTTEWLSTTPAGYFDGSSDALNWVNYVKGNQVVNVANLFEKYYTPGLIERVQNGEVGLNDRGELLNDAMESLPDLTIALSTAGKRSIVLEEDSIVQVNTAKIPLEIGISQSSMLLDEIRIYNNGKLVIQEPLDENIAFRGAEANKRIYEVELSGGINRIHAVLVNAQRTESSPTTVVVEYNGTPSKTDLFVLTIGINTYKNPAYNLNYAVNDAASFMQSMEIGGNTLFDSVYTYSLTNAQATKQIILQTIDKIKSKIGNEDVFVFYYAGHGVMSNEIAPKPSEFFIVTHDVTNLYDAPAVIRQKAIAASELMTISKEISAEKQLFILDACHSGGAIESFALRGSEREKALAQLARNTGTFFLTAAQDAQFANEVGKLNHGLFTYALLELLNGTVVLEGDDKITVNELKTYVEERVPELSEKYQGSQQYPTGYSFGRDFPIVLLK